MSSSVPKFRDLSLKLYTIEVMDFDLVHKLHYRRPTNQELVGYQSNQFRRKGKKIISQSGRMRLEYGTRVLAGFVKGTIGFDGKLIASDPDDPDYREDWKELLVENLPDVVSALGRFVFESIQVMDVDAASDTFRKMIETMEVQTEEEAEAEAGE